MQRQPLFSCDSDGDEKDEVVSAGTAPTDLLIVSRGRRALEYQLRPSDVIAAPGVDIRTQHCMRQLFSDEDEGEDDLSAVGDRLVFSAGAMNGCLKGASHSPHPSLAHDEEVANGEEGEEFCVAVAAAADGDTSKNVSGGDVVGVSRPPPLLCAAHAVVQAYRDDAYVGTCVLVLCVPNVTVVVPATSTSSTYASCVPVIAVLDAKRIPQCRVQLCGASKVASKSSSASTSGGKHASLVSSGHLICVQNNDSPQYVSLFDPLGATKTAIAGAWWSLMFKDRAEATAFVTAVATVRHYWDQQQQEQQGAGGVEEDNVCVLNPGLPPPFSSSAVASALPLEKAVESGSPTSLVITPWRSDGGAPQATRGFCTLRGWVLRRVGSSACFTIGKGLPSVIRQDTLPWGGTAAKKDSRMAHLYPSSDSSFSILPSCDAATTAVEAKVGSGTWMTGLEEGVLGMRAGETRVVFVRPGKTRVCNGVEVNGIGARDTVVVHVTCTRVEAASSSPPSSSSLSAKARARAASTHKMQVKPAAIAESSSTVATLLSSSLPPSPSGSAPSMNGNGDDATRLLQRMLLQCLATSGGAPVTATAANTTTQPFDTATASVMASLNVLSTQVKAIQTTLAAQKDVSAQLEANNVALEAMVRRAVGTAPRSDVTLLENAHRDRDALLAALEKAQAERDEVRGSYHTALESLARHAERTRALEGDVRVQSDLLEARSREAQEVLRLRLAEAENQHRAALQSVKEEQYARGREDGRRLGVQEGIEKAWCEQQELKAKQGGVEAEAAARMRELERALLQAQTASFETKTAHLREGRALREELEVLRRLNERQAERLERGTTVGGATGEGVEAQCKRVKRLLNAVYTEVESDLLSSIPQAEGSSASAATALADNMLAILARAIKEQAAVCVKDIKTVGVAPAALHGLKAGLQERDAASVEATTTTPPPLPPPLAYTQAVALACTTQSAEEGVVVPGSETEGASALALVPPPSFSLVAPFAAIVEDEKKSNIAATHAPVPASSLPLSPPAVRAVEVEPQVTPQQTSPYQQSTEMSTGVESPVQQVWVVAADVSHSPLIHDSHSHMMAASSPVSIDREDSETDPASTGANETEKHVRIDGMSMEEGFIGECNERQMSGVDVKRGEQVVWGHGSCTEGASKQKRQEGEEEPSLTPPRRAACRLPDLPTLPPMHLGIEHEASEKGTETTTAGDFFSPSPHPPQEQRFSFLQQQQPQSQPCPLPRSTIARQHIDATTAIAQGGLAPYVSLPPSSLPPPSSRETLGLYSSVVPPPTPPPSSDDDGDERVSLSPPVRPLRRRLYADSPPPRTQFQRPS